MPAVTTAIYRKWKDSAFEFFTNPEHDRFFLDKAGALEAAGGIEKLGQQIAQNELDKFRSAIDSASLVFAHSVVDEAVLNYLKVTFAHSADPWIQFIKNKSVKISEINGKNYNQLVRGKVLSLLNELERQSLLIKSDQLFQICLPEDNFRPIYNFVFSRERLEQFDELRHEVIHGTGAINNLPNGDDDILFLHNTANYYMALVNMRFNTRIDPIYLLRAAR